ncbi:hypothetical protein [Hydrogenophaga sp.]|jgi:hypothetical protein|uniref:hypothetical protein n=1 Tax=Hydrogenophaga sp. TaxID=1904254 RepID=UPI00271D7BF2|nr:hypothetical protein [Hydrogenophaga sp.]MDO9149535.1 hypothetical protein [Hydrogenophaga sp.]MDP2407178.1 hypothetical protein [Hydrogenophaga sp.]MDP3884867.1 hypothetical protein [Hydrogenophaga sp.]MDZ4175891.1 hypothetical protein [Hydrogenophaga sp.]
MPPSIRSTLLAVLAAGSLLLPPMPGLGESVMDTGVEHRGASAALNIRLVFPPFVRVLENSHPQQINPDTDGSLHAEQKLVVMSNLKRGFCVTLRQIDPQLSGWQLQIAPQSGIQLSPVADGYHLCSAHPGRYTLLLQHQFASSPAGSNALNWPIQTDLTTL